MVVNARLSGETVPVPAEEVYIEVKHRNRRFPPSYLVPGGDGNFHCLVEVTAALPVTYMHRRLKEMGARPGGAPNTF